MSHRQLPRAARRARAPRSLAALAALVALAAACGRDRGADVDFAGDDSTARAIALGPGDVRATSVDGAVDLAVVGDTVRFQLGDSLRRRVRTEVDSSIGADSVGAGALGGLLARSVGGIVGSAMGVVVRIPVRDVTVARCEPDGRLRLETRGNHRVSFRVGDDDRRRAGDEGEGARFTPEGCRLLVAAIERRRAGGDAR